MGIGTKINEAFKPLYTSDKRYFIITGGRGSLKSTSVHDFICRLTYSQNHGILFTRYTMASAEKSIIPEFLLVAKRNNSILDFDVTRNKIVNRKTGSFILFSGIKTSSGDQTANLKSIAGITTWVIDEGEDFQDERTFDDIDDSVRSNVNQNRVIWIQNPSTKEHFIYKRFIEQTPKTINALGFDVTVSGHPDVESIHTTYNIAREYLSESFLKKADDTRESNPKRYYHKYVGGWLEKAEGVVYENWKIGNFDNTLPIMYGLDFGFNPDPTALIKVAVNEQTKTIYLHEELYKTKLSHEELIHTVKNIVGRSLVVADINEQRTTEALRVAGVNIENAIKTKIVEGIRLVSGYSIIVTSSSINAINELNNYAWLQGSNKDYPIDAYNHTLDPLRYIMNKLIFNKKRIRASVY
jgi:phage terminase large subunit